MGGMGDKGDSQHAHARGRAREWRPVFLKVMGQCANVTLACRAAGVSRKTAYQHRNRDEGFAEAWDDAIDRSCDALEVCARQRATVGRRKPVFQGGVKVGTIWEYSDTLLMFLLKAYRPEKFRENYDLKRLIEEYRASEAARMAKGRIVG